MIPHYIPIEIRELHDTWGNAPFLLERKAQLALDHGTWFRTSGDLICPYCNKDYYSHPQVIGALWLRKICTGEYVHL